MKSKFIKLAGLAVAAIFCTIEANAQVGIGTPTPADAAQLEILAGDKGILIPRVALTATTAFAPVTGTEAQSLLVFNTMVAGTGETAVAPGFYYWVLEEGTAPNAIPAHWERIVNQTQLNAVLGDNQKIKDLLNVAFPSNNINDTELGNGINSGGGLVYTPETPASGGNPSVPASFSFVYYDAATSTYIAEPVDINELKIILGDVINANANTSVFTGNTYVDGSTTYYIYRGEFTTTVTANTAQTTGITIDKAIVADGILSATLRYGIGATASITSLDIDVPTKKVDFNVGVGNMYNVLGTTDITAKVIVEFAATDVPAGL